MVIGIDIRSLLSPQRTGVGEYAYSLLDEVFKQDKINRYVLFYNSFKDVSAVLPKWNYSNVRFVGAHWPNKIFNAATVFTGYPHVDNQIKKQWINGTMGQWNNLDYFFSPNPSFTSLSPNIKHILTIHDLSTELLPDCFSWKHRVWHRAVQVRRQARAAHKIVVPSENTKRDVARVYGVDDVKITVLYPGVSSAFQRTGGSSTHSSFGSPQTSSLRMTAGMKYILFLGTIEPRKNIEGVMDAFMCVRKIKRLEDYQLVIAGAKGWKDKSIFEKIKNTPGVKYIGYVAHEDKPALYANASAFVYPSLYEGFGLPVLEAMSMGVPVVTSNRSSLPEVTNGAAYLVNPYNVEEIATGLEKILTNEQFADTLRERGQRRSSEFSWQKTANDFIKIIAE